MDVSSGAVHVTEPVVYDAIEYLAGKLPDMEKPDLIPEELKE